MNMDDDKVDGRESSKDFGWIRTIKMKWNELTRVEGSITGTA